MINGQRMFLRGYGDDAAYATTAAPPTDRGYDSLYNSSFAHLFLLAAFRSKLSELQPASVTLLEPLSMNL